MQQLCVRLYDALAALVDVDERRATAVAVEHMAIDGVEAEIRLAADEPAERRRLPLEHAIPLAEPRQIVGRSSPQGVGIAAPFVDPALNDRCDDAHGWPRPGSGSGGRWRSLSSSPFTPSMIRA